MNFYFREKIAKSLNEMKVDKEINFESLTQVQKLNLILYFIEKEHHFTGNGIWIKSDEVTPEKPQS